LIENATDAADRAAKSCETFNDQCVADSKAAFESINKAAVFSSTSAFICQSQGQECMDSTSSTVKDFQASVKDSEDFDKHCINGQNPSDFFWCAGDIVHVIKDLVVDKSAIDNAKYKCGFGEHGQKNVGGGLPNPSLLVV
jgi:hypothetical protein